jgi:hypothetical protein
MVFLFLSDFTQNFFATFIFILEINRGSMPWDGVTKNATPLQTTGSKSFQVLTFSSWRNGYSLNCY